MLRFVTRALLCSPLRVGLALKARSLKGDGKVRLAHEPLCREAAAPGGVRPSLGPSPHPASALLAPLAQQVSAIPAASPAGLTDPISRPAAASLEPSSCQPASTTTSLASALVWSVAVSSDEPFTHKAKAEGTAQSLSPVPPPPSARPAAPLAASPGGSRATRPASCQRRRLDVWRTNNPRLPHVARLPGPGRRRRGHFAQHPSAAPRRRLL